MVPLPPPSLVPNNEDWSTIVSIPMPVSVSDSTSQDSRRLAAAILMPEDPNSPNICSKYIIRATYQQSPDEPSVQMALSVNSDVAVPKFKSKGATRDHLTSQSLLRVEFKDWEDVTGFAEFAGEIGKGIFRVVTDKEVVIFGPIDGGPKASQRFVGTGTWTMS